VKNYPLVSVIVPTYNRAHTLERALESVYAQTFHDYEIIVVDDGSTDKTRSLVNTHVKKNSFQYIYQENKGVAEARNTGVRSSKGEYVAFCDSDDFWLPKKLEKQLRVFAEDTALVYSDAYLFEDAAKPKGRFYEFVTPHRGGLYADLLKKNFIATSTAIVRRSFIQRPFAGHTCEDWRMWLSVAKEGLIDYVDEPLAYYYEHSQGLSKSKAKVVRARLEIRKQELKTLQSTLSPDAQLRKEVKRLILKDVLFLFILTMMPESIMKKIDSVYYNSKIVRSIMSKTPLSS